MTKKILALIVFFGAATTLPANLITNLGCPPASGPSVVVTSPTGLHLGAAAGGSQTNSALPY